MSQLELVASNLTNATHSKALMPATVVISGNPFLVGRLKAELAANVDIKQPTFSEKLRLSNIPAVALNSLLAKYGSVYAKSGTLDFYTEMVSKEGNFEGYVRPYFQNLEFEPVPKDRGTLAAIWSSLANGIKDLMTNDQGIVATDVPVKGTYKDPTFPFWTLPGEFLETRISRPWQRASRARNWRPRRSRPRTARKNISHENCQYSRGEGPVQSSANNLAQPDGRDDAFARRPEFRKDERA